MSEFKKLKLKSESVEVIGKAVNLLKQIGYRVHHGCFSIQYACLHGGLCTWDDGIITEGWYDDSEFKNVTIEDLKEMVNEFKNTKTLLWLNKRTLEEKYTAGVAIRGINWVKVPDGATFATRDKDNFVFRKDGMYCDNQICKWVETDVTIQNLPNYEFVKLFWVKGEYLWRDNNNEFTLERLLGCEVELFGERFYLSEESLRSMTNICTKRNKGLEVGLKCLTFFTEYGDELTFDEYVNIYYGCEDDV